MREHIRKYQRDKMRTVLDDSFVMILLYLSFAMTVAKYAGLHKLKNVKNLWLIMKMCEFMALGGHWLYTVVP